MNDRDEQGNAKKLLQDYLHILQSQFYGDDPRLFFKHRYMLIQAIAAPAKALKKLGVWLPDKRLREILNDIILGIKQKGDTGNVNHFAAYFLTCVQSHMRVRNDHYYEEGKVARARSVAKMPLEDILQGVTVTEEETPAQTIDRLVELATTFKPKRRAKNTPDNQLPLF